MARIVTSFTKLMNIATPIVGAPMAGAATPEMAAAITGAGGFGFIGTARTSPAGLKHMASDIRTRMKLSPQSPLPVGFGFMGYKLDETESSDEPLLPTLLLEKPSAIWLSFGDDLSRHIMTIRDHKSGHRPKIFVMVSTVRDALKAANELKADVIVAQGIESGGHGLANAPPILILLQSLLDKLPNGPPILAAGGISTGNHIAALLTMGASGVVCGTRFLCSPESSFTKGQKATIMKAGHDSTARGMYFDEVRRMAVGWPKGVDGRGIANGIIDDVKEGCEIEERLRRYDESIKSGDESHLIVFAGVGVGFVNKVESAEEILSSLHRETVGALTKTSNLLVFRPSL